MVGLFWGLISLKSINFVFDPFNLGFVLENIIFASNKDRVEGVQ